jgi:prepilin-type N-terminal cleavage/methylation domain-containing protein
VGQMNLRPSVCIKSGQCIQQGFTLVEMLVSLVLSAIIFVSAYQVISNLIQYQVRYNEKSERQMDRLLLRSMIGQILSKGLHQSDLYFKIQKNPFFKGNSDSIQIISRAYSDHFDVPGYRIYSLSVNNNELFVSYKRFDEESVFGEAVKQTSGIRIEKIGFRYYLDGEWLDRWSQVDSIPKLVKVIITLPDNNTFEWVNQTGQA